MQGTPAHIEYVYDKDKIKGNSCKICEHYFDGVYNVKKIALYDYKHAKYCGSYRVKRSIKILLRRKREMFQEKKIKICSY